ncbi:AMP-binding protein [Dactylosporangium sp. NPDC000555]|uniref:AMP-binding protein n=1 Tax=Dactylosporangium sp. NPDC000555 TaxID=3154260 RepID=UPI00331B6823
MVASQPWEPSDDYWDGSRLQAVMRRLGTPSYSDFYEKSITDTPAFWAATLADLGWQWAEPYGELLATPRGKPWPEWFIGGRTNIATNSVDRWLPDRADDLAVVGVGEDGRTVGRTFAQLRHDLGAVASRLAAAGVRAGDRVSIYLPFDHRAAAALLGIAHLGAVAVPMFTGYGPGALAQRIRHSGTRVVLTCSGFVRGGRTIDLRGPVDVAVARAGAVSVWDIDDILADGADDDVEPAPRVQVGSADPLLIAYTSGTSGRPKAAVHTHTGLPLKVAQELAQLMDVRPGSVMLRITDMGWIAGPYTILSGLAAGATLLLYSGAPTQPDHTTIWRLVERFGVTHLGLSATLARIMRRADERPAAGIDIGSLRLTNSTGEPWDPATYHWYREAIGGGRLPIINHSGGTEVGNLLACVPVRPIVHGEFNTAVPGVDVDVAGPDGSPAPAGEQGDLIVRQPFVGMTRGLWEDDRYPSAYWSAHPGCWNQGDRATRFGPDRWRLDGRADDRIKVSGRSVMPDDVEAVAVSDPRVSAAVAIGVPDEISGNALVLLAEVPGAAADDPALPGEVRALVRRELGAGFAPSEVHVLARVPRTQSGKAMRQAARAAYLGETPDTTTLTAADAEALREIGRLPLAGAARRSLREGT